MPADAHPLGTIAIGILLVVMASVCTGSDVPATRMEVNLDELPADRWALVINR